MPLHSSLAIANEFLTRARSNGRNLTQMQVQKLVFLAHGWSMAVTGQSLIEDDIEAWDYGPVIRKLYDALRNYGRGPITRLIHWGDDTPFPSDHGGIASEPLDANELQVVDRIWEVYGSYPAFKLSALTHAPNSPWDRVYTPDGRNRVITNDLISDYFQELAAHA